MSVTSSVKPSSGSGITELTGDVTAGPGSGAQAATITPTTGSGDFVRATSPTLVTPALGTPSALVLTNATGLPVGSITGLGTGVGTFLATPSSANLASAVTGETGSGALVFATSPALVTPDLGTPSAAVLTNATGLPVGSVTGLGANVATFLGTPSSANLASAVTGETGSGALVFGTGPTVSGGILTGATDASGASALLVPTSAAYAPTADGSLGYDSTQDAWSAGGAGAINGHIPRVLYMQADTTDTLAAATISTAETAFAKTFTIPASYLIAGKTLRLSLSCQVTGTAGPTSTIRVRLGGVGGTLVYSSQAGAVGAFTATICFTDLLITGTAAAGASVNVITGAFPQSSGGVIGTRNGTAQPVAVATNASQALTVTQQYSANTAGNTITLMQMLVEELN